MHIKKFKKGTINLKLDKEELKNPDGIETIIYNDDVFWNDLYFYPSEVDGWLYIYDSNKGLVYPASDYGFDTLRELQDGSLVKLRGVPNNQEWEEYEWNDGMVWDSDLKYYVEDIRENGSFEEKEYKHKSPFDPF
jgi:hypothetical protein